MGESENSALDWQKEIYLNGLAGIRPKIPTDFSVLEASAKAVMTRKAFAYVAGGAGSETTLADNRSAFDRCKIIPRVLCDVGERDTSITLFNQKLPAPFLLSPIGVLELVHPEADLAVAQAVASLNVPFIFSNQASRTMESCAAVMGSSPRWFQLYWSKNRDLVQSFVQRAERCGCSAVVVTLDTTMLGWRRRDLDLGYLPFLEGKGIAQYTSDPVFQKMLEEPDDAPDVKRKVTLQTLRALVRMVNSYPGNGFFSKLRSGKPLKAVRTFISTYSNPCTTWDDLQFLRACTKLPIVLKGVLHPDDARKAMDYGVDGIIVSNHGGRQVDGAISTFEALPHIVNVIAGKILVIMDSGVRGGADAFRAIATGANAVCIGRPYAYGLAFAGREGVHAVIRNFMAEFELTMGLAGCKNIGEINQKCVRNSF